MSTKRIILKRVVDIAVIILIFSFSYACLAKLSILKKSLGTKEMIDFYAQPGGSVDVVFLGSSYAGMDIDEATLWDEYGIASYCPWGPEQAFWMSYYTLLEVLKYQNPKAIVLECGSVYHSEEYQDLEKQGQNISGMRLSLNKIQAVMHNSPIEFWDDMLLVLPLFHDRLLELGQSDYDYLFGNRDINNKGFFNLGMMSNGEAEDFHTRNCKDIQPISEKSENYLRKIIEECNNRGVSIILIQNPYPSTDRDPKFNYVAGIAKEYDIPYINYNSPENDLGLSAADFYDDSHMNKAGGRILTKAIGREIVSHVQLEDHRDDPQYESWDFFSSMCKAECLKSIPYYDEYWDEIKKDGFFTAVIDYQPDHAEFFIKDYSDEKDILLVGNDNRNHTYEYNGHVFTADFQDPKKIWVRYDGESLMDINTYGEIVVVYDKHMDSIVDVIMIRKDLYGKYEIYRQ